MASLDDLLRQLGIGGVARNRAGQIVTNTNDIVPVATAGLADTLYGAGRGTLAGTAAIGGIPGDINQMYVNKFGALFPNQPAPPTSEQISTAVKRAVPPLNLSRDNTGSVATSLGENVVAPITAPESLLGAARATKGLPVGMSIKEVKQSGLLSDSFNVIKRDASDTFGAGTERIRYVDPKSGGTIEVLSKPDNTASVMSLEVPEQFRGKKIGESLQARALQDFPELQGQVSSKAAAKTAYRLGRRPVGEPNATLDDVFKAIEDNSSVNLVSPEMQKRFTANANPVKGLIETAPDISYRSTHEAPGPHFGAPLHDLTGGGQMYPADVYSSKAVQYYGTGFDRADQQAFAIANSVKGNPNATVTMYRAVPKELSNSEKLAKIEKDMATYMKRKTLPKDANTNDGSKWYDSAYEERERLRQLPDEPVKSIDTINAGDWVTLTKDYAKQHGESVLNGKYKIISKKVKAKDLWTNADSIQEFGYNPSK